MNNYSVVTIPKEEVRPWLLRKHYAKRVPSIVHAFGLYCNGNLVGVSTFGMPPSNNLCEGICGVEYKKLVLEFNRMCLEDNKRNEASYFIGKCLKLIPKPKILVSYADTGQNHSGYIYQATNWIYTGLSAKRTDADIDGDNRHPRTSWIRGQKQKQRSRKHRYIYFIGSKKEKREMLATLKYPIQPYPKKDNINYDSSAKVEKQLILF